MKSMLKVSSWSLSSLKLALAVTGLIVSAGVNASAQDQTVSGHLRVTNDTTLSGTLNVSGVAELNNNVTNFGANGANAAVPGLVLTYTDAASGTVSTITLATSGTSALWQWERNSASDGLIPQMTLTGTNSIILWSPTVSNSAGIILNPAGDSTFSGSITATGTNSRLPNQQPPGTDTVSILTVGQADERYLTPAQATSGYMPLNPTQMLVGGNYAATNSVAIGNGSRAEGVNSLAVGYCTKAVGAYALAAGDWTQAAQDSIAVGSGPNASGYCSAAFGNWTQAQGNYTTAIGNNTIAQGESSVAMGVSTKAFGYAQLVTGQFNIPSYDDAFIIGNGASDQARSNIFTVKKNGNVTATGDATIGGNTYIGGGVSINGATVFNGKITVTAPMIIAPQGDITMGDFGQGGTATALTAAANYINTLSISAGVSVSSAERRNIESFLIGLNDIVGLENVEECWSLRSTQNSGTGNTAYGLLGKYNGTLVNNPSWGTDGMNFVNASGQYISTSGLKIPDQNVSVFSVFKRGAIVNASICLLGWRGIADSNSQVMFQMGDANNWLLGVAGVTNLGTYGNVYDQPINGNSSYFNASIGTYIKDTKYRITVWSNGNTKTVEGAQNVAGASGFVSTDPNASLMIGASPAGGRTYEGKITFVLVLKTDATAYETQIYELYKSTIGQGLSLP